MAEWQRPTGPAFHAAAMTGRPVLAFGTPRYGPTVKRHALCHFETGRGWRESATDQRFDPDFWQPLPEPPNA